MDLHFELPQLVDLDLKASSCFRRLEVEEHVSLLPCYIGRIGDGVTEHLNRKIMRYSNSYSGVLLAYSTPTVLQTTGKIMDEQPHLHFDIRYLAYTFKPVVGSILCGTVNKIGRDHIGCLVYQCFNASITQRHSVKKSASTGHNGVWIDPRGSQCDIGAEIYFRVLQMEVLDGVLSIKGDHIDMEGEIPGNVSAETANSKKHKKHKKHRHSDSTHREVKKAHKSRPGEVDRQSDFDSIMTLEGFSHEGPKVKKPNSSPDGSKGTHGKKRKRDEAISNDVELSSPLKKRPRIRQNSDEHHKHKKSKKHKK